MTECTVSSSKSLIYIDLDEANGERLQSLDGGATWIKSPIVGACLAPCARARGVAAQGARVARRVARRGGGG